MHNLVNSLLLLFFYFFFFFTTSTLVCCFFALLCCCAFCCCCFVFSLFQAELWRICSAAICCVSLVNIAYTPRAAARVASACLSVAMAETWWGGGGGGLSRTVVLPFGYKNAYPWRCKPFLCCSFCRRVVSSRNFRTSVGNIKIATKYKSNLCALFPYHFYTYTYLHIVAMYVNP